MTFWVTSEIYGGQGNQMFQVAMAYVISKEFGVEMGFHKKPKAVRGKVRNIDWDVLFAKCKELPNDVNDWLVITDAQLDSLFATKEILIKNPRNIKLDGYMQSSKYLIKYKKDLQELFLHKDITDNYSLNESVAIHIRTFESNTVSRDVHFYMTTPWAFYKSVLHRYSELSNMQLLIFIDDISDPNLMRQYFPEGCIIIEDEYTSLYIMAKCRHLIRTNSTFSWWAAFLSDTIKTVYIPHKDWIIENNEFNEACILDNFKVHELL